MKIAAEDGAEQPRRRGTQPLATTPHRRPQPLRHLQRGPVSNPAVGRTRHGKLPHNPQVMAEAQATAAQQRDNSHGLLHTRLLPGRKTPHPRGYAQDDHLLPHVPRQESLEGAPLTSVARHAGQSTCLYMAQNRNARSVPNTCFGLHAQDLLPSLAQFVASGPRTSTHPPIP